MRKITSLTAALSFIAMLVTSVVLYIVPQGRVAYWSDWRLWGLSKTQWGELHINLGLLFFIALGVHLWYNWKPIMNYLKDRAKSFKLFTAPFNTALILVLLVTGATLAHLPPVQWVLDLNAHFQEAAADTYGEPPYGHAELSTLGTFCKRVDLDEQAALQRLKEAGLDVTAPTQIILDIATANGLSPKALYLIMRGPVSEAEAKALPAQPAPGTGRRPLADIAAAHSLDMAALLQSLREQGYTATATSTLLELAKQQGTGPEEVYAILLQVQAGQ